MAETAVNILIEQLAAVLIQEAKLLSGAKSGVTAVRRDLEMIRAFLLDADQKQQTQEAVKEWVKQVRETAYDIEDTLDEFFYRMERPSGPGLAGFLRRNTRFFRRITARHKVANKVQDLRSRLSDISKRKDELSLAATGSGGSGATTSIHPVSRLAAQFVEESELVGIEKQREQLIRRLVEQNGQYAVISVVGMGGVGKTTLVRKVYEDPRVKNHFTFNAWVTASQTFVPEDLLRSMIKTLPVMEEPSGMAYIKLVETLRTHLMEKRYVIILDDIWSVDAWEVIKCALPENGRGSRIMVTTRDSNVATHCSKHKERILTLEPLPDEEAWSLFCKKVFWAEPENRCPDELEPVARNILKVCGGLPLAIAATGGILLTKPQTLPEWQTINESIRLELKTTSSVEYILGLSYDSLPPHLKRCFLYFGVFPEDSEIKSSVVAKLWIAEGFINPVEEKSPERTSEEYLTELVCRSLVQASRTDCLGRVRRCRVHDLVRDLILSKSKEQNFHLFSAHGSFELPDIVRRFAASSGQSVSLPSNCSRLRSLLLFHGTEMPSVTTFRFLKVFHMTTRYRRPSIPIEIYYLIHLRYLHLECLYTRRSTRVGDTWDLPEGIYKLKNLQTLHLININLVVSVPNEILELEHLRHIMLPGESPLPKKIGNLTSLQTLGSLLRTEGDDRVKELGKLTQLKKLGLEVNASDGEATCAAIKNMSQLQSLHLSGSLDKLCNLSFSPPFLKKILLHGHLPPELLSSLPSCLEKVTLLRTGLETDPLTFLQHLPGLVEINLGLDAYEGEEVRFESEGFRKLKKLCIRRYKGLRRVVIDQGAMPNLEYLALSYCDNLGSVTGIEHLRNLKVKDIPGDFD